MAQDVIRLSRETKDKLDQYRILLANHAAESGLTTICKNLHDASYSDLIELSVSDALIFTKRLKNKGV